MDRHRSYCREMSGKENCHVGGVLSEHALCPIVYTERPLRCVPVRVHSVPCVVSLCVYRAALALCPCACTERPLRCVPECGSCHTMPRKIKGFLCVKVAKFRDIIRGTFCTLITVFTYFYLLFGMH
jgi:hypothetical protein